MSKRKVVITLDDSQLSQQIIPTVEKLFSPHDTALLLFGVVTPQTTPDLRETSRAPTAGDVMSAVVLHDEHTYLRELERRTQRSYEVEQALAAQRTRDLRQNGRALEQAGFTVSVDARIGEAAETIITYAETQKVDLIAMATHGRRGISRLLMGSVTEEVVRTSKIPVLLIRPGYE